MNKKAERESSIFGIVVWALIIIIIIVVMIVSFYNIDTSAQYLDNLPDAVQTAYSTVVAIVGPLVEGLYWLVAPSGEGENVQMIAFAIFLLIVLVGSRTLRSFIKGPYMAFFISAIVGIIASRSLTATILEDSAIAASPLAAASLILGFIPVYAITKNIDNWGFAKEVWSKMVIYTVIAAVYIFFFWIIFDAAFLGWTYGIGIVLLGATEMIAPYYSKAQRTARAREAGSFIGRAETTLEAAGTAANAEAEARR